MWCRLDVQRLPVGWMKVATDTQLPVSPLLCTLTVRQRLADQKLMALPKEAARFASLKASDTVCGEG